MKQLPWAEVKKEMTQEKGLDPTVAEKIGQYVKHKGTGLEGKYQPLVLPPFLISSVARGTEAVATALAGCYPYVEQECERRFIRDVHSFHPPTIIWRPRQGMLRSLNSTPANHIRRRSRSTCP